MIVRSQYNPTVAVPFWTRVVRRFRAQLPLAILLSASIVFRIPVLLNAGAVNSDAAIVGLQGLHMLRGEWSPFLWGAGYQSSIDAVMAALGFLLAGFSPLTLVTMALTAHLVFSWLAWDVLRKRLGDYKALVAMLPLVFTPMAVNIAFIYVARQWCIATIFLSIWLLDGASESRYSLLRYGASAIAVWLAVCMDLFALLFTAGLGILALACSLDGRRRFAVILARWAALVTGGVIGHWIFSSLRSEQGATASNTQLTLERLKPNFKLLSETCLPWTLSQKVFANFKTIWTEQWLAPSAFRTVQELGAVILICAFVFAGASLVLSRIPWKIRRLGFASLVLAGSAIGGFLLSVVPSDAWSCRYLSPIIYAAPFALAPIAYLLRTGKFVALLSPYVVSVAVGGWVSYGIFVHGPFPTRSRPGVAREEEDVAKMLRGKGIQYAAAQYWLAYRYTLLFKERPIVVPLEPGQDRYPPYRDGFNKASRVAYIFHPDEPRASPEPQERELRFRATPYERIQMGDFTVLIAERAK